MMLQLGSECPRIARVYMAGDAVMDTCKDLAVYANHQRLLSVPSMLQAAEVVLMVSYTAGLGHVKNHLNVRQVSLFAVALSRRCLSICVCFHTSVHT